MLRRAYDRILALSGSPNAPCWLAAMASADFRRHGPCAVNLSACLAAGLGSLAFLLVV